MLKLYELFMLLLIIISVSIPWMDFAYSEQLDLLVWLIFVIDYTVRLWISKNKKKFVKTHILDLIALIPLDSLFRAFRIFQFFRVFRLSVYAYRYAQPFSQIIQTNGLSKVLAFTMVTVVTGAAAIEFIEPDIESLEDALWWAMVTTTTVGYGDISPKTGLGRVVAVILMVVGIGTMGMITGSIATYFLTRKEHDVPSAVKHIQQELDRFHELSDSDLKLLIRNLESLVEWKREQGEQTNRRKGENAS